MNAAHHRHDISQDASTWEPLLEKLVDHPDFEWLMIDTSNPKVPPHATGAKEENQAMSRTKGG